MDLPDILAYTSLRAFMGAWFAAHGADLRTEGAKWLAAALKCTRPQAFNLLSGERKFQLDQAPALARALQLEGIRREHLRRLVVLQNAGASDRKESLLAVWELHSVYRGVPADALATLLARDEVPGASDEALQLILCLLRTLGAPMDARDLASSLVVPPDPARLRAVLEATDPVPGTWPSPRVFVLDGPGWAGTRDAAAWHGIFDLGRECLLRVPPDERDYSCAVWSADGPAARKTERALTRLHRQLQAISARTAAGAVTRIYALSGGQVGLTELGSRPGPHPAFETSSPALPSDVESSREQVGPTNQPTPTDAPPCLYRYLDLPDFAKAWIAWRRSQGLPCAAEDVAMWMGLSKTLANNLCTGAADLHPKHVLAVVEGFGFTPLEAPYLEGMARYAQSKDLEERARLRHALVEYAGLHGVRTPEGEQWRVASHWASNAIWAMAFLGSFRGNAAKISCMLRGRIPVPDAQELLTALLATGLLVKPPSGPPRPAMVELRELSRDAQSAAYAYHDSVLRLLQQEVILPAPGQHLHARLVALPDAALPLVRNAMEAYKAELVCAAREAEERARTGQGALDRVLLSALQLFPVSTRLSTFIAPEVRRR